MESTPTPVAVQKAQAVLDDTIPTKFTVSLGIFLLSLFAVSFPALSKRAKFLRIPSIVFFLGKHFGTGVILSTAFVHLLPDAFKQLQSRWTGFIILLSLLTIFLVEYISTAYVDHLQSYSSAPPSPTPSIRERAHSHSHSHPHAHSRSRSHSPSSLTARDENSLLLPKLSPNPSASSERTPLLPPQPVTNAEEGMCKANHTHDHTHDHAHAHAPSAPDSAVDTIFGTAHHRFERRGSHAAHSGSKRVSAVVLFDDEGRMYGPDSGAVVVAEVPLPAEGAPTAAPPPRTARKGRRTHSGHVHGHGHGHGHVHLDMGAWSRAEDEDEEDEEPSEEVRVGRRRQVVGILMLQLGIMLHSCVIGLTLSITKGSEFTTLATAILFHQLFEGLSLGIRIAALPSAAAQGAFARLPGRILQPVLALAFALTVPAGIAAGLLAFARHDGGGGGRDPAARAARLQGLMSAMSAGMLVYAACVEMLAGDFVMDPTMWRSGLPRQAGALLALGAGVCAMAFIGH